MPASMPAPDVLNREYLEIRAKILEVAASLDRLDRGEGDVTADPRYQQLLSGIELLKGNEPKRAEQVQLLFSLDYDPDWRAKFGIEGGN